jgi:hypothetical protein
MTSRKNFRMVTRLLGLGGVVLCLISMSMTKGPGKNILLYVALAMGIALLIQIILYTSKPGLFKDKSSNPD